TEGGAAATEAGGEPIRVGASLSLTGEYARIAEDQNNAYELWVEQTNDAGGLLGRPVELIVYDDRSQPETGTRLYEKLITEDKVDLIMGPYSSAVSGGMMVVAERHSMVNIAPMASSDELFEQGYEWSMQVITPASDYLNGALDIMKQEGLKTFAYVGEDSAFPAALAAGLEEKAPDMGLEMVFSELYPVGTRDFSSLLQQIQSAKPDAIFGGTYAEDAIAMTGQMKQLGVSAEIIALTVGAAENEYYESVGKDAEQIMGASHWEPALDTPGNDEFVKAYTDKFGKDPGYHAAGSYAGFQLLGEAVDACQCLDQKQVRQYLWDTSTETVFGEFDVEEGTGAQVGKTGVMVQWLDKKKEIIWPDDVATSKWQMLQPWSERG
ncbi:MAG: amino acid ABC transporter substrate-binding protein, partial [Euzebyales bacterium]|nr:amino acid ABC transporter substrate-binding protein [Euzebyales bacterium]